MMWRVQLIKKSYISFCEKIHGLGRHRRQQKIDMYKQRKKECGTTSKRICQNALTYYYKICKTLRKQDEKIRLEIIYQYLHRICTLYSMFNDFGINIIWQTSGENGYRITCCLISSQRQILFFDLNRNSDFKKHDFINCEFHPNFYLLLPCLFVEQKKNLMPKVYYYQDNCFSYIAF